MITNAQIQAMIAVGRAALIELLAAFYVLGGQRGLPGELWYDALIRELIEDVDDYLMQPERGRGAVERWNRDMGCVAAASPDLPVRAAIATSDEVTR